MIHLVRHECCKIWLNRRFLVFLLLFLIFNGGFLFYSNNATYEEPSSTYYNKLNSKLIPMNEQAKLQYLVKMKEQNEAFTCLEQIAQYENKEGQQFEELAKQLREEHTEAINKYHDQWVKGEYLEYGESLSQQEAIINSYYNEIAETSAYEEFLEEIQSKADTLSGISIFASTENDGFSHANIQKTVKDYKTMGDVQLNFMQSKAAIGITENAATDIFLVVLLLLVVSLVIFEEKQKRLFYITKITPRGRTKAIVSKQASIFVTSFILVILFELLNILYYRMTLGPIDWGASMQSIAPWMPSTLKLSVIGYLLLYGIVKAVILGVLGCLFLLFAIITSHILYPFVLGTLLMTVSFLLYYLIPETSSLNWFKHLNPVGILQLNKYLANYLNLNFFGHPVHNVIKLMT